jgi:hypothetical protein
LSDIRTFEPFLKHKNVSFHFNLRGHNYLKDFSFFVFIKDCDDNDIRINLEYQLILIFKNLNMHLLNDEDDLVLKLNRFKNVKYNRLFKF